MVGVALRTDTSREILAHLLRCVTNSVAVHEPFSHVYFENIFPSDLYAAMMANMPEPDRYRAIHPTKHSREDGTCTRNVMPLDASTLQTLSEEQASIWRGVSKALSAPELKAAIFRKLAPDLALRFGIPQGEVDRIVAFTKPSLLHDLEGYEIPPIPMAAPRS